MKKLMIILCLIAGQVTAQSKEMPAYLIYKDGKKSSWNELAKTAEKSDIVFFGEFHNNPIHHWLQFELTRELHKQKTGQIILGAEMFEADNQLIMNEYLQGLIRERNFLDEARLWPNYKTDYKPLMEFARENELKFIATNVPRRYAAAVSQGGFDALERFEAQSRLFLPPFPIPFDAELPGYAAFKEMGGMGSKSGSWENFAKAQALKDATMAWFIVSNLKTGYVFLHFNGAYHTDNKEGIVWYINNYLSASLKDAGLKILTISCEETDDMNKPPSENKADFMIMTPSAMTKTH
jgi:uncharacterized iron-regulated protein